MVIRNIHKMLLIIHCYMSDLAWKFSENPFIGVSEMLLKVKETEKNSRDIKTLPS